MTRRKPAYDPASDPLQTRIADCRATVPVEPVTAATVGGVRQEAQQADIFDLLDAPAEVAPEADVIPLLSPAGQAFVDLMERIPDDPMHFHIHRTHRETNGMYTYPAAWESEDAVDAEKDRRQARCHYSDPWVYGWHRCTCEIGERALARVVRSHFAGAPGRSRRCVHCGMDVTAEPHGWQAQFHAPCTAPNGHDGGVD